MAHCRRPKAVSLTTPRDAFQNAVDESPASNLNLSEPFVWVAAA